MTAHRGGGWLGVWALIGWFVFGKCPPPQEDSSWCVRGRWGGHDNGGRRPRQGGTGRSLGCPGYGSVSLCMWGRCARVKFTAARNTVDTQGSNAVEPWPRGSWAVFCSFPGFAVRKTNHNVGPDAEQASLPSNTHTSQTPQPRTEREMRS